MKTNYLKTFILTSFIIISSLTFCQKNLVLTLEKSLKIAENQSPDLISSRLDLTYNEELLKAQEAAYKAQLYLMLNPLKYNNNRVFDEYNSRWYSRESKEVSTTFSLIQPVKLTDATISLNNVLSWHEYSNDVQNITDKKFKNNFYLSVNQPLFTYNRTKMKLNRLKLNYEESQISYSLKRLSIEKKVTQEFYNLYSIQQRLSIAMEEFKNQEKNYTIVKRKSNAGIIDNESLFQAEVNYISSQLQHLAIKNQLENEKDRFKQTLGLDLDIDIAILADINLLPLEVDLEEALDHATNQRLELRQKEIQIEEKLFNLIEVQGQNEFKGSIEATIGIIGENSNFKNVYNNPENNTGLSVKLNIPVWDWGEKKSRIKAAKTIIKSAELSSDELRKDIILSIKSIHRNLDHHLKKIELGKINEKNAKRAYDINMEKFNNASISGMELQQYQNQLTQKKMDVISAMIAYKLELLNLKIQTLWDFINNKPILHKSDHIK